MYGDFVTRPGSARKKSGKFSIWRVPNYLFEARGYYLGQRVEQIDRINRWRSLAGGLIVIGVAIYSWHPHPTASFVRSSDGQLSWFGSPDFAPYKYILGLFAVILAALLVVPLASLILVARTRPGARGATAKGLLWPLWSILLLTSVSFLAVWIIPTIWRRQVPFSWLFLPLYQIPFFGGIVVFFIQFALSGAIVVWVLKCLYLCAAGLFRADDGHPFLSVFATPIVGWLAFALLTWIGLGDDYGVPQWVGLAVSLGGPVSLTILSLMNYLHLRGIYQPQGLWPLNSGPLTRSAGTRTDVATA